jgi:hypothetical protein
LDVHSRFIHVTEDSSELRSLSALEKLVQPDPCWVFDISQDLSTAQVRSGRWLPLGEGELGWQFDHRFGTSDREKVRLTTLEEHTNPNFEPAPVSWVHEEFFKRRLQRRSVRCESHLLAMRRISSSTNERTAVACILPFMPVTYGWILLLGESASQSALLAASLNSLVVDYCIRNKIAQASIPQGTVYQLPILAPAFYNDARSDFVIRRVLELSYTSFSLAAFAHDLGYSGPPFSWSEERRSSLRADLDAFYARAYELTRGDLQYILDPADVKGSDYPSETFRVLKEKESRRFGEYKTRRLVLAAWDRMEADGSFKRMDL